MNGCKKSSSLRGRPLGGALLVVFLAALAAAAGEYTVQPGDTLFRIATRELGAGSRWIEIARLNDLVEPYAIRVGETLRLPDRAAPSAPAPAIANATAPGARVVAAAAPDSVPPAASAPPASVAPPGSTAVPPSPVITVLDLIPEASPLRIVSTWPTALRPAPVGDLRPLDLATAIAEALERSGEVRAAIANRSAIEARIKVVAAMLWPQVNATVSARRFETGKSISPMTALDEHALSGDLTLSQSLYSFGRIPSALRAVQAERAAADAGVAAARNAVRFRVESAFLGLLLARERFAAAREALEVGEALLLRARAREEAGAGTRFDVMRAEAERASALARIVDAEARKTTARELLAVAMGLPPASPVDARGELGSAARPVAPERALALLESRRPDLAILRHRIASSEAQAGFERSQSLPSLDLFASANYTRRDYIRPPNFSPWRDGSNAMAGVAVTVPIFDGFRARHAARAQDAATRGLAAGLEEARHGALLELRSIYHDLGAASERIAARAAGVKAAEEALRMAQLSFAAGRAAALDVIQASYVLSDARRGEAEARHDYHLGLCRLIRATGASEAVEGMGSER